MENQPLNNFSRAANCEMYLFFDFLFRHVSESALVLVCIV